jgi:hypothetical protein
LLAPNVLRFGDFEPAPSVFVAFCYFSTLIIALYFWASFFKMIYASTILNEPLAFWVSFIPERFALL